jgi:NAD(P)-dependent dehydrogenase (short-subunit alcohol dehydrogenase family)
MTWHPRQLGQQTGRTFVVTGANSGIGLEAARDLVGRGAHVVLAVRDTAKGEQAAASLAGPGSTSVVELDLSDLDQVRGCAKPLLDRHDNLSALICNAGVMGGPLLLTPQGFERQMATNHLGHAALVAELWPLLHASGARVVLVSSHEARGGQLSPLTTREQLLNPAHYDGKQVYRNTKQANLLFAQELHRRCAKAGSPVSALAVHPGASATNLFARQLERAGHDLLARVSVVVTTVLLPRPPPEHGPRSGRSTTARRAAPSSAPPGSPSSAARRSCSTSTPPPRTRRRPRACGSSPSRCSAGRCQSDRVVDTALVGPGGGATNSGWVTLTLRRCLSVWPRTLRGAGGSVPLRSLPSPPPAVVPRCRHWQHRMGASSSS